MEPITANTQLSFKRYYNVNLYVLLRRKVIWFLIFLAVVMLVLANVLKDGDDTLMYLAIFYFVYVLLMPLLTYLNAKRLYKKIAHMSEPKVYEFSTDGVKITGQTVKMEMAWSNINKAVKRKDDYILFSSSNRNFFSLPNSGFADEYALGQFETLLKEKVSKRNF